MTQFHIDHLHLKLANPESCAAMLVVLFDAVIVERKMVGPTLRIAVDLGELTIFIDKLDEDGGGPRSLPFKGIEHLAVHVADMHGFANRLAAQGLIFSSGPRQLNEGLTTAFLTICNDFHIEVLQRGCGIKKSF